MKLNLMTSSLQSPQSLLKEKLDGITERRRLQEISANIKKIDLFSMYADSLFSSILELAAKNSNTTREKTIFLTYVKQKNVQKSISIIRTQGNLKIKLLLYFLKYKLYSLTLILFYVARKCKVKMN